MKRERRVVGLPMKTYKTGRQVVDWKAIDVFVIDGNYIKVLSNEMVTKVSKSGNERKERRLDVTMDGINIINVGTEAVKRGSFIKKLYDKLVEDEDFKCYVSFQLQLRETKQQGETETLEEKLERVECEYDNVMICYKSVKETFTKMMKEYLVTDFKNIGDIGNVLFETVEERIEHFDYIAIDHDPNSAFGIIYENEWRVTYRQIFLDFFTENWDEIWSNTIKQWCEWHGIDEDDYYNDERNTYTSMDDDLFENEYDELFRNASTVKEVKRIYRQWSKQLHPDCGGNAEDFKELNKAYENALEIAKIMEGIMNDDYEEVLVPLLLNEPLTDDNWWKDESRFSKLDDEMCA